MFSPRLGCSSISFRQQSLPDALTTIRNSGFEEIDLGALPGVCDHVPFVLDAAAVQQVSEDVARSGLRVRSVNADIGDLNAVLDDSQKAARQKHLAMLVELAAQVGAKALVLPCGALDHEPVRDLDEDLDMVAAELSRYAGQAEGRGVQLWTESPHFFRLCWNTERASRLMQRLDNSGVGVVMDFSHVVASRGDVVSFVGAFLNRIRHVHLRDAVPGNINLSIGNGEVDFAAGLATLERAGYDGHFSLELETHDVDEEDRPKAAVTAAEFISSLLQNP